MARLLEFDIAKGLCILLVVMGHYAVENPSWWVTVHDIIYAFHMPLFMFASGFIYIAFKKDEDYRYFLWKKIKRLMTPYITTSVIVVTIKLLTQNAMYVEHPVTPTSYLRILYLPEAGYFLWFIWALWWMFCVVPLFKNRQSRTILFSIAVILHLISPYVTLPEIFCIRETAQMLIWFMIGVMCYDWKIRQEQVKTNHVFISLAAFAIMLIVSGTGGLPSLGISEWLHNTAWGGPFVRVSRPLLGIFFIMSLSKWISQRTIPSQLVTIAGSSYLIYLLHTTFMGFTKAIIMKITWMQSLPVLTILIVVSAGVICPIIFRRLLKFSAIGRFLFGVS